METELKNQTIEAYQAVSFSLTQALRRSQPTQKYTTSSRKTVFTAGLFQGALRILFYVLCATLLMTLQP